MIPPLGGILGISFGAHNLQSLQCPGEVQVDRTLFENGYKFANIVGQFVYGRI